jgi:hypothetical protein
MLLLFCLLVLFDRRVGNVVVVILSNIAVF